ncbi:unnamed protein product, partial [Gongylonema pulchrum]|uniref:F-box domain-containing protein n=1 Tax=Gongylonema pulchrum TaxID=637853 RepID=A0A183D8I2_9BILA
MEFTDIYRIVLPITCCITLTTPFDIHSTLMDILHWPSVEEQKTVGQLSKRSLSLFRPIPSNRTCRHAGIEPHWCTCLNWELVTDPAQLPLSTMLVQTVIDVFNNETEPERTSCA